MPYTTTNRCPGSTWAEREVLILKSEGPLVIKDYSLTEFDDILEDFIHNYLVSYNYKFKTAKLSSLSTDQCSSGRLRSLVDLFLICKHYFHECTLEEVKIALYNNYNMLSFQICSTIKRRVYWIKHGSQSKYNLTDMDEFGLTINQLNNK